MNKRILIIGGYGNFGSYIADRLSRNPAITVIISGRSLEKASALALRLGCEAARLDIFEDIDAKLSTISPDIVIHTSGPFQGQDAFVARACIRAGCHYIDLADGHDFVRAINTLDHDATQAGVLIVSGASSVPCLSSAIIDHYLPEFTALTHIDYGITTAQKTSRGHATTAAILGYTGQPFDTLIDGQMQSVYGWQGLHRETFKGLGKRYIGNCDIPDLALFKDRYPDLQTQRFYAGLELPFIHVGLWALSWLARWRILPNLSKFSGFMLRASNAFDIFGSDESAFYMRMQGLDKNGAQKNLRFDLTAGSGDGPFIPCMPSILLTEKLVSGETNQTGAMPCMGFITMDEYLEALKPLDITWKKDIL